MAASSNPGGNSNQEGSGKANPNNKSNNSGSVAVAGNGADNSVGLQALKHNTGLAVEWSIQEQAKLEDCLAKYAGEPNISKYVKIATLLPDKTVRDVAIRCRWMSKKESGKRRKPEEQNATKKIKDKKEKTVDPSVKPTVPLVARSTVPMYNQQMLLAESDDGITYEEIGGLTGQLLQQNAHVFIKITENLHSYQIQENIDLFFQTRSNIATILNDMNDMPGVMSQMPPLPVKVNEQLADTIIRPNMPQVSAPLQS